MPNLYVEGGIRRLSLDLHAKVETSRQPFPRLLGSLSSVSLTVDSLAESGESNPRRWRGFGVGSDVDVTATARAEWQFARHFGIAMGYGGMHFSDSDTVQGRTLTISPTLHGPIFGLGIFF